MATKPYPKNQSSLLADKQLLEPIQRLADALDLESISVNIYEIEPVNGLAAPDGKIFITRGFYNKFTSGEITGMNWHPSLHTN